MATHSINQNVAVEGVRPETRKVITISLIHFNADKRLHKLQPEVVNSLAESMQKNGLITPVVVSPSAKGTAFGYQLIAGHHRIEAARKLGWGEICASIMPYLDPIDLELAEIDDNLVRGNLVGVERQMHLARRVELHEQKYEAELAAQAKEDARRRGLLGAAVTNKLEERQIAVAPKLETERVLTGAKRVAKDVGITVRAVQRAVEAVNTIPDIGRITKTSLDREEEVQALVKLVKAEPEQAEALIVQAQASPKDETISAQHVYAELKKEELRPQTARLLKTLIFHMKLETEVGRQIVFDQVREVYEHPEGTSWEDRQKRANAQIRALAGELK